jgi:hypothetical protein
VNLLNYFELLLPVGADLPQLVDALSQSPSIEHAYIPLAPGLPSFVDKGNPLLSSQSHLEPAPIGIDAFYAWKFPGGLGKDQNIIDIEAG